MLAVSVITASLHAQAPTEQRLGKLQFGGAFAGGNPDYYQKNFYGPTFYVDFDIRYHLGIEASASLLNGPAPGGIKEQTYQLGVRYGFPIYRIPRIRPYLRGMYGQGIFNCGNQNPPLTGCAKPEQSLAVNMYSMGGGVDYRLNNSINLRLVDFQYQHWASDAIAPTGLSPEVLSVGVAYVFH